MRDKSLLKAMAWQWTQVAVVICPCLFRVPSTFRAWRGGIGQEGSVGDYILDVVVQPLLT